MRFFAIGHDCSCPLYSPYPPAPIHRIPLRFGASGLRCSALWSSVAGGAYQLARHGNADAGRGTTPAELIELQPVACSVGGLWVVAATSCMGCLGCVSIDGMELDQKPTQSPGPAWWRPPRAIVWLGRC